MRRFLPISISFALSGLLLLGGAIGSDVRFAQAGDAAAPSRPKNVLFIAIDDLRPELGCYGQRYIQSPHIDQLASEGVRFDHAYCQYAVCWFSRASVMTGLRPSTFKTAEFRKTVPNVVTFSQHFKRHGYFAQSLGKIYHGSFSNAYLRDQMQDPQSWSAPRWTAGPRYYYTPAGVAEAQRVYAQTLAQDQKSPPSSPDEWTEHFVRALPSEAPEIDDDVAYDGQLTQVAIRKMREVKDRPFFLAVGYLKPHLPFVAPKKYWDLYDPDKLPTPEQPHKPIDAPRVAMTNWGELRAYSQIPRSGPISQEQAKRLRHGYAACVSYIDAQIGLLLQELDRLGLRDDTIVILWSDHGFKLGDLGMWAKHTNFEHDTRVPLIIRAPGLPQGVAVDQIVELLDLYPTTCQLAGLPLPSHLEGKSMVDVIGDEVPTSQSVAYSEYRRGGLTGYSLRNHRYRYTEWHARSKETNPVKHRELYDFQGAGERKNIAASEPKIVEQLCRRLQANLNLAP
ncbi:MAG: sulfatase [Blastopirellula sp. JB062]